MYVLMHGGLFGFEILCYPSGWCCVSGSLPVHGIGTANFIVQDDFGIERIWSLHNCLLCHSMLLQVSVRSK
jgi:hypothetical protein